MRFHKKSTKIMTRNEFLHSVAVEAILSRLRQGSRRYNVSLRPSERWPPSQTLWIAWFCRWKAQDRTSDGESQGTIGPCFRERTGRYPAQARPGRTIAGGKRKCENVYEICEWEETNCV